MLSPRLGVRAWVYFSHKVVRTLVPVLLPMMLCGSLMMMSSPFYTAMTALQLLGYLTMPLLLLVEGRWRRVLLPQYYLLMNIGLLVGSLQYLLGSRKAYWERTPRS